MKVLYILHQFFPLHHTGTERLTLDLAKQIQRMGHYVSILTYEPSSVGDNQEKFNFFKNSQDQNHDYFSKVDDYIRKAEYQVETIPVISLKHTEHKFGFDIFEEKLEKYLKDIIKNFDIVHFTHPMRFSSALNICKQYRIPTVLTLTDAWLLCPRGLVTSDYQICNGPDSGKKCMQQCNYGNEVVSRYSQAKFFFDNVNYVVAGSDFVRDTLKENHWAREVRLIPFSVDFSHVKNSENPKKMTFGFMGTLIWHKGLHVLINAFKMVENNQIQLKIYGQGDEKDPYVSDLKKLAEDDHRIEFCGIFDYKDLPKIMDTISVMVVPSSYPENFPLVMQTSLAYKKPVIVSNMGGMPEVIEDGVNGFLFDSENVEQLARIIHNLSKNPTEIQELQENIMMPPRIEEEAFHYQNIYSNLLNQ